MVDTGRIFTREHLAAHDACDAASVASAPLADIVLPPPPEDGLARPLEKKRLQAYLAMVIADAVILLGSFAACAWIYLGMVRGQPWIEPGMLPAYLLLPLFLTIALYNGSYSRHGLTDWQHTAARALVALVVSAALLNFIAFFAKANADFSRVVFTAGLLVTGLLLVAFRILFTRAIRHRWGAGAANLLVISDGGPDVELQGARVVHAGNCGLHPDIDDPAALDRLAKYLRNMDHVVVSCAPARRASWAEVLKGSGIRGEIVDPAMRELGALGVQRYDDGQVATLMVSVGHLGIRARATKRAFDLALGLAGLVVLSPLLALCAIAIKLEDGGPVLFRQRRMGRGNSFFDILKFRTMREADGDGARSASRDDERVTRVGRLLRRTSVDELPQLWNVVKGDMSIVGPRPHALGSQAGSKLFWQVDRQYWQRHSLRPGITGLAQVRGLRGATDSEAELAHRLQADLAYLRGWSLWRDIRIVFATLRVLRHDKAY